MTCNGMNNFWFKLLLSLNIFLLATLVLVSYPGKPIRILSAGDEFDYSQESAIFNNDGVGAKPIAFVDEKPQVLGDTSGGKRIEVDLTNQRVYAYEGDRQVYNFLVSTGKWGRTPTGTFEIWVKYRYTKMSGGSKALHTYYYLPNVPYTMFFYNNEIPKSRGYGIHGTYWHSNFGHTMSHGCINMKTEEAGPLYYWANPQLGEKKSILASAENPGTKVIIYGTPPKD